ncbi:hypothetical protein MMC07_003476 [Pseudocyphellaria aurata]|nr:hypothetical protein [Pseudocyphellaria aurata]
MSPCLPKTSDFPSHCSLDVIPPPASFPRLANVLILLHGLGDTKAPFSRLGRQLNLPDTTCIALQGPMPLPFELGGFHWGDDILFDQTTGRMELDAGFTKAVMLIKKDIIEDVLVAKCGYQPREMMLFGFGQGAMAAIATALSMSDELGGVVSVGGPRPASEASRKSRTPLLVLGGSSSTWITRSSVASLQSAFEYTDYQKWNRPGDGMPQSQEEMLPIMRFFARRLKSPAGVPEGSVELG